MSSKYTLILKGIPFLHVNLVLQWYTSHRTFVMGVQGLSLFEIHMREVGPCFICIYCCQQDYTCCPYQTENMLLLNPLVVEW